VRAQVAAAFQGDIGITSSLHPDQPCTAAQAACLAAPTGGAVEVDDAKMARVTFYSRTLAVPARRAAKQDTVVKGSRSFANTSCASCHTATQRTASADVRALADQVIPPYTDLLLHDMGAALADAGPEPQATGAEWRTPPLWGIGLVQTVNGHTR